MWENAEEMTGSNFLCLLLQKFLHKHKNSMNMGLKSIPFVSYPLNYGDMHVVIGTKCERVYRVASYKNLAH